MESMKINIFLPIHQYILHVVCTVLCTLYLKQNCLQDVNNIQYVDDKTNIKVNGYKNAT